MRRNGLWQDPADLFSKGKAMCAVRETCVQERGEPMQGSDTPLARGGSLWGKGTQKALSLLDLGRFTF